MSISLAVAQFVVESATPNFGDDCTREDWIDYAEVCKFFALCSEIICVCDASCEAT